MSIEGEDHQRVKTVETRATTMKLDLTVTDFPQEHKIIVRSRLRQHALYSLKEISGRGYGSARVGICERRGEHRGTPCENALFHSRAVQEGILSWMPSRFQQQKWGYITIKCSLWGCTHTLLFMHSYWCNRGCKVDQKRRNPADRSPHFTMQLWSHLSLKGFEKFFQLDKPRLLHKHAYALALHADLWLWLLLRWRFRCTAR